MPRRKFNKDLTDFNMESFGIDINKPADFLGDNETNQIINNNENILEKQILKKKYMKLYEVYECSNNRDIEPFNDAWGTDVIKNKMELIKKISSLNADINDKLAVALAKGSTFIIERLISQIFIDAHGFSNEFLKNEEIQKIIKQLSAEYLLEITISNNKMRLFILSVMILFKTITKNKMLNMVKTTQNHEEKKPEENNE